MPESMPEETPEETLEQFFARTEGQLCPICRDEKARMTRRDALMAWTTDQGVRESGHSLCFWQARCHEFEQLMHMAHRAACSLVASRGGMATVTRKDIARAELVGFQLETEAVEGGIRYKLPARRLSVVASMPAGLPPLPGGGT